MARYIEQLSTCDDPTYGDYFWIVDASAGATDKDRKVDAGIFARKGVDNSFSADQTISKANPAASLSPSSGRGIVSIASANNGSAGGGQVFVGRNSNASTPAAGHLRLIQKGGGSGFLWSDNSGNLRIDWEAEPIGSRDTNGTVVGTQTSSLDSKNLQDGLTGIEDVLAAVKRGAEAVRRFTYKNGSFNGEAFEGVVTDFAPRYGMDRDEEHEAGKSLNLINAVGDLLRAVAWLVEREQARA